MKPERKTVKLAEIVFNESIYPRKNHDPSLVQKYFDCIDEIESRNNLICVAEDFTLLDGRHRHLAYIKKHENNQDNEVPVFVYPVGADKEKYALAVELNSTHGAQLSIEDKQHCVIKLYSQHGFTIEKIAKLASVRKKTALEWTKGIRADEERRLNETIFNMWLSCHTQDEIAKSISLDQSTVKRKVEELCAKFPGTKSIKLSNFEDDNFSQPLYNVWAFGKKSNEVSHFGNSEQRILENLLYLYTDPFDIVVDPFAGGGATIDVCKKRLRRYWVSDRKPIVERENEIRTLDVVRELPPLHKRWSDVTLTFLDPPYWRQAWNKYSADPEDLANMPLDKFTECLAGVINGIAAKQSRGVIAMLMQPTQWNADGHEFTDHISDIIQLANHKRLKLENRVSCPYSTQQCTPQQVEWAKDNKKLLVISRELIVWRLIQ